MWPRATCTSQSPSWPLLCWGCPQYNVPPWTLVRRHKPRLSTSSKGQVGICELPWRWKLPVIDRLCSLLLQWGVIILFAFLWILICIIRTLLEKLISRILIMQSEKPANSFYKMPASYSPDQLIPQPGFSGALVWSPVPGLSEGTHPPHEQRTDLWTSLYECCLDWGQWLRSYHCLLQSFRF